jgi:hypothetical protein
VTEAGGARRVAVVQSNYVPWKGYFDLIGIVDEFVLYDDVQYTKNDWRNRNRIKTANGVQWLTIPVAHSGRFGQRIDEVQTVDSRWREKHWRALSQAYAPTPFFARYRGDLERLYLESDERALSAINRQFIEVTCRLLGISTRISRSTDYRIDGDRSERLVALCRSVQADTYLSGPAAKSYLDESLFKTAGVNVEYMDYSGYQEYPQLHPPFEHSVTVLDLLFNVGPDAPRYMKGVRRLAAIG